MNRHIATALGVAASLAAFASAANAATTINLGTVGRAADITGSVPYTNNETVNFKFTVDAPYTFTFTDTGSGGTFPFPIGNTTSGGAGTYTESYGAFPVSGTLNYSLVTSVPEPAAWALMLVGFGAIGAVMRRRIATVAA